jgi:hypothetical protein
LVRHYLKDFNLDKDSVVLDPFCGTGTTVVEAKSKGFRSIGVEAYPFSHFVSLVKTDWSIDHHEMVSVAAEIAENVHSLLGASGIDDSFVYLGATPIVGLPELEENRRKLLIKDSISPVPLQKSLTLLTSIDTYSDRAFHAHMRLAFAKTLVSSISNLHFGPEVGVGKIKRDSPVIAPWLNNVKQMAEDLDGLDEYPYPKSTVHLNDSRVADTFIRDELVDAVITSPPYPNEKDYTRTTRLETVLLGFINSRLELRSFKKALVRSNTRGVYKADTDDHWIRDFPEIIEIANAIEARRVEMGKTSGFERQW